MSIAHWPENERPREKLLARGAGALSDAELLAILLRTGVKGQTALDVGRSLLGRFGSLSALFAADAETVAGMPGLGVAKYTQLAAARELARRSLAEEMRLVDALTSPQAVIDYLRLSIGHKPIEVFVALYLSAQNRVLAVEEVSQGTVNETRVYPREIVKRALVHNAAAVIVAHNHPSGVAEPSAADRMLTSTLKAALELVEIRLLDHLVISAAEASSLAERGWL
ncbi:RadC family protein [Crenobacter cavernae]|uniref:JAB domain-containing protein n=1 Tax=Crenobacter cavernae TaxID=2290923 RepID=A0A345Y9Z1_9NEIS|nr:DNA repair protein RadC [Crenobacter cavernae]AXK40743.1 JAB domain-containing protein [Crenobacter cavernae]